MEKPPSITPFPEDPKKEEKPPLSVEGHLKSLDSEKVKLIAEELKRRSFSRDVPRIKIERSSGEVEGGWQVREVYENGTVLITKPDPERIKMRKVVPVDDVYRHNHLLIDEMIFLRKIENIDLGSVLVSESGTERKVIGVESDRDRENKTFIVERRPADGGELSKEKITEEDLKKAGAWLEKVIPAPDS